MALQDLLPDKPITATQSKTRILEELRQILQSGRTYNVMFSQDGILISDAENDQETDPIIKMLEEKGAYRKPDRSKGNKKSGKKNARDKQRGQSEQQEEQPKEPEKPQFTEKEIQGYHAYSGIPNSVNPYAYVGKAMGWE